MRRIPENPNQESNGDSQIIRPAFRPAPKPSQIEGPPPPPKGWYWCAAGCGAGLVGTDGGICLACRMGWTPDAAEIGRIEREYPKG